jgi:hypothetical protein
VVPQLKLTHIFGAVGFLTLAAVLLGTFRSDVSAIQYLGNTAGVLLGFVLGVWWQETERNRLYQTRVERFWSEYKAFLLQLESKVDRLKNQVARPDSINDSILELRLPLPEASHFERRASELDLAKVTRQEIETIADRMRVLDEYMDLGSEKLREWQPNFGPLTDNLWVRIRELNVKHSGKTAI